MGELAQAWLDEEALARQTLDQREARSGERERPRTTTQGRSGRGSPKGPEAPSSSCHLEFSHGHTYLQQLPGKPAKAWSQLTCPYASCDSSALTLMSLLHPSLTITKDLSPTCLFSQASCPSASSYFADEESQRGQDTCLRSRG